MRRKVLGYILVKMMEVVFIVIEIDVDVIDLVSD